MLQMFYVILNVISDINRVVQALLILLVSLYTVFIHLCLVVCNLLYISVLLFDV